MEGFRGQRLSLSTARVVLAAQLLPGPLSGGAGPRPLWEQSSGAIGTAFENGHLPKSCPGGGAAGPMGLPGFSTCGDGNVEGGWGACVIA